MTYLIGCSYHGKDQGWRVRKCLATPASLVFKKIARKWFAEEREYVTSFRWTCHLFGFNHHRVREKIAERTQRTPIYKKGGYDEKPTQT